MNVLNTGLNFTQILDLPLGVTGPINHIRATAHDATDDTLPPREVYIPSVLEKNSKKQHMS